MIDDLPSPRFAGFLQQQNTGVSSPQDGRPFSKILTFKAKAINSAEKQLKDKSLEELITENQEKEAEIVYLKE